MTELSEEDKLWVKRVSELTTEVSQKLDSFSVLNSESVGSISLRLAKVRLSGRNIDQTIVPRLLESQPTDIEALAELTHDLMTELDEIRYCIEAMNEDVVALMNAFNK